VLAVVGFLIAIGFGVMSPVLPVYARTFGVSSFLIGLVVSSLSILRLITMPVCSRLLRRIGPRELAIAGNLLVAATTLGIGVSNSYWGILAWRGLSGFGSALYGVSSMALLFAAVPPPLRGRANAISGGGFVLGGMAGPALGGLIAAISIRAPFFFYTVTLCGAAVALVVLLPRTPVEERTVWRDVTVGLREVVRDRRFRAVVMMSFASGWQSDGVRALLVPLFVVEVAHRSTVWAGIAFAVAAVAQAACLPLTGWGTDRLGRRFMMVAGGTVVVLASGGLAWTRSYGVLVVILCIYAISAQAAYSASQALLADTVPVSTPAGLAAFQMAGDIGRIVGPLVAGAILDVASMTWAWGAGIVFFVVALALTWRTPAGVRPPVGA
jgi:MFS family permease